MERIRRIVGVLAEYDAAAAWLAAHPDAPDLPANAGERLTKAQDDLLRAEQFLDRERRNREQSAEQLTHIAFDETLLAHGDAIEQLIDRAGAARQAMLDIPKREAEHALTTDRIAGILRQLGSDAAARPGERGGAAARRGAAGASAGNRPRQAARGAGAIAGRVGAGRDGFRSDRSGAGRAAGRDRYARPGSAGARNPQCGGAGPSRIGSAAGGGGAAGEAGGRGGARARLEPWRDGADCAAGDAGGNL